MTESLVEEPSYNVKLAKTSCWEGQDKQTGIQTLKVIILVTTIKLTKIVNSVTVSLVALIK